MNPNPPIDNALRVALVTGSTSGIGAAIARTLSRAGYAVVLHSRNSADTGRAMAAEMKQAIYVQADLAVEADRVRLVKEAIAAWGQLDVLVNNAGISRVIPHSDLASATSAVSLGPDIRVNAVAPGLVDTPLTAEWTAAQELWRDRAPMRRAASPDDIAKAAAAAAAAVSTQLKKPRHGGPLH